MTVILRFSKSHAEPATGPPRPSSSPPQIGPSPTRSGPASRHPSTPLARKQLAAQQPLPARRIALTKPTSPARARVKHHRPQSCRGPLRQSPQHSKNVAFAVI
ncbi:unnamed protein product [Linum trigynum]|uniref:Uncharacterized protein n=1 Tax=Linum trigynum TaxID=586398 RepID=A0AAV2CUG7_9ROSI